MTRGASPLASVLVVDDETGVRDLLTRWLAAGGYDVHTASNATEALRHVTGDPPAVAVCDIRMPGHDGLWLAQQIRQTAPETAVIMATGVQDAASAVTSVQRGAIDYLTKPFGRDRLRESVSRGVEWHRSAREARRWREALEEDLDARRAQIAATLTAMDIDSEAALDRMLGTVLPDARAHAQRVAALAVAIADGLRITAAERKVLTRAALLHDLGKVAVPDAILRKPAPLTPEEQAIVRMHPAIAFDLLAPFPWLAAAAAFVRHSHERTDGLGFPDGLRGDEIPRPSRVIAVADAFDTMTHARVFRDAISPRDACLEVVRCGGTQFDPEIVDAFARVVAQSPIRGHV